MPPIIAAPAMRCWQPSSSSVSSPTSRASPSTNRWRGWESYEWGAGPYLEWLSSPVTWCPRSSSSCTTYPPMKPAAPVTSTCAMDAPSAVEGRLPGGRQRRGPPGGESPAPPAPERVQVPAQVAGEEPAEVESGLPELAVQPDGGYLRHRQAQPGRLRGQLQADLEPGAGLDPDRPDEVGVVRLEAVRGVVGSHPRERVQAEPRPPGQRPLQARPTHLLAT